MKKFYLSVALAMTMAGCTHEELANSMSESRLDVTMESADGFSRVGFEKGEQNDWTFFWHNGDEIWVNSGIMSTSDADGSTTATFTGYGIDTSTGYAIYPYAMAEGNVSGTQLTWNLPATYTYDDVDADFFASAQGIPMYAEVKDGKASFKHLGAIVAFKFNDWTLTGEHVFTLTSSKKISGAFTADLSGTTPVLATQTDGEDVVTVTYNRPADADETSIVFYVPIPTGTYDLKVQVTVDGANKFTKTSSNKTVNRGDIVWAEVGESILVGDNKDAKVVETINDITEETLSTTEKDLAVTVEGEVSGDNTIEIPASLNTTTTAFRFASVADGATITIKNAEGGAYSGQVIIEVPAGETIPTVNAYVPDGEVYIKQGTVTTLNVSSKENTTIIGTGVKVGKITVNQGNVRVEKDGEIGEIANSTGGTLYITDAGGTLPGTLPDNTIIVYEDTEHAVALNGTYSADRFADLMGYAKDVLKTTELSFALSAGTYDEVVDVRGGKNITIAPKTAGQAVSIAGLAHQSNATPSTVVVRNVTLDNTLQTEGWFTGTGNNLKPCVGAWGGDFTFEGCNFVVEGTSGKETGVMTWWITDKMSLTFNECTFEGKDSHTSARAMQIYGNADLKVTNCTFNTYKDYSLKYVAKEGNVATFEGNKVYNSKYLVQLGSAQYAGSKYTAQINNTTLGEGINHYYIDNEECQMVYIDGVCSVSTSEKLTYVVSQGVTNIMLADGEYDVKDCGGKELTISGSRNAVLKLTNEGEAGCDYGFGASDTGVGNYTFNGITINTEDNDGSYKGYCYMKATFNDCSFVGAYSLNNENDFKFYKCTFDFKNGYFWTWAANSVTFEECTFTGNSKAILAHGGVSTTINIKDCQFNATEKGYTSSGTNTACVEIDPTETNTYTISFTGTNTKTEHYNGWTRIKDDSTGHTITGVE